MGFAVFELKGTGVNTTFMFCMPVLRMCSTTMRRGIAMETGTDGGDIRRSTGANPEPSNRRRVHRFDDRAFVGPVLPCREG